MFRLSSCTRPGNAFLDAFASWAKGGPPVIDAGHLLAAAGLAHDDTRAGVDVFRLRQRYIEIFGFCVPQQPFVDLMRDIATPSGILEVGAGSGFLSRLLHNSGISTTPTDARMGHVFAHEWMPVLKRDALRAIRHDGGVRTVLCSWPSYRMDWLNDAINEMVSGQRLALIGESEGGCTGSGNLFDTLATRFRQIHLTGSSTAIWQFPAIHDHLTLFERR